MKKIERYGTVITAYQDIDINSDIFQKKIEAARKLWSRKINEKVNEIGDRGSCVLGAGIFIYYLGPRKRKPIKKILINPHSLTHVQGECVWQGSASLVVEFLKEQNIKAGFDPGRMD